MTTKHRTSGIAGVSKRKETYNDGKEQRAAKRMQEAEQEVDASAPWAVYNKAGNATQPRGSKRATSLSIQSLRLQPMKQSQ